MTFHWGIGRPQLIPPARTTWRRELSSPGKVFVSAGDQVKPDTEVADGRRPTPLMLVSLGRTQPVVGPGEAINAGQVLARRKLFLRPKTEVRSTVAGTVRGQLEGELVVAPAFLPVRPPAQLPGIVSATHEGWGVDIEGNFGLVYGTGGGGAEVHGRLGEEIAVFAEPVTQSMLGAAVGQGVRALVAPSLASQAMSSITYILTERLSGRPMAPPIAEMLLAHLGMPAAIQFGVCPLLAFASEASADACRAALGPGSWVRLPDGRAARVTDVEPSPRFFPSGIRAVAAHVDFGDRVEMVAVDSLEWVA